MATLMRLAREAKGIRQFDLAIKVGCSPGTLSLIENGQAQPAADLARSIAAALGLEVFDLFPKLKEAKDAH